MGIFDGELREPVQRIEQALGAVIEFGKLLGPGDRVHVRDDPSVLCVPLRIVAGVVGYTSGHGISVAEAFPSDDFIPVVGVLVKAGRHRHGDPGDVSRLRS